METHNLVPATPHGRLYASAKHFKMDLPQSTPKDINAHIHDCFEIYLNLSGDVSLVVEGNKYAIKSGDVIITMPREIHYIIMNSDTLHDSYCMWLSGDGAYAQILAPFCERVKGKGNKISLDKKEAQTMTDMLEKIAVSDDGTVTLNSLSAVIGILSVLEGHISDTETPIIMPPQLTEITSYIENNLSSVTVFALCNGFFISRSSLGRLFRDYLGTTPSKFIEDKRLANAKLFLEKGYSVQATYEKCGFADYSHFIARFKKRFSITPFRYKKSRSSVE